jgi:hypothetical protein
MDSTIRSKPDNGSDVGAMSATRSAWGKVFCNSNHEGQRQYFAKASKVRILVRSGSFLKRINVFAICKQGVTEAFEICQQCEKEAFAMCQQSETIFTEAFAIC